MVGPLRLRAARRPSAGHASLGQGVVGGADDAAPRDPAREPAEAAVPIHLGPANIKTFFLLVVIL